MHLPCLKSCINFISRQTNGTFNFSGAVQRQGRQGTHPECVDSGAMTDSEQMLKRRRLLRPRFHSSPAMSHVSDDALSPLNYDGVSRSWCFYKLE